MVLLESTESLLERGKCRLEVFVVFHHIWVLRDQLEVEGEEVEELLCTQNPNFLFSLSQLLSEGLVSQAEFTKSFDVVSKFTQSQVFLYNG